MKRLPFLLLLLSVCAFSQDFSRYVNPFIGTGGHGHTFPGATTPFGMVQLSPDTRIDGSWDGCSGYHYSDSVIYGFSHTHLSGTGVPDYGDIMLMPTMGEPSLENTAYSSSFSHSNEKAAAGFYSVTLDKYNIKVALTTSTRVGFHQYTFNKSGQANIILDLNHRDKLIMGKVRVINGKTIEVYRNSAAWAPNQKIYARIEFDRPMKITKVNNNAFAPAKTTDTFFAGSLLAIAFSSEVKKGDKIQVKVSLSPTSTEGATKNMAEIKDWNFNKTKVAAQKLWDKELGKIEISSSDKQKLAIFYTALYHTMIQPNIAQDIDGKYRGRDDEIHTAEGFDYYTVFSLWDTFRGAHPLYTLIEQKRTSDFINTFIKEYEQGGRLPVWELASNETDCMIGYHSVSVIADAMVKGIKGFDYEKAFEASKHSATLDHLGLAAYKKNGFISIDDEHESVSKTVEYAYDDWCIAQMAEILGKTEDRNYFMKRSQNWKNLFDTTIGFMRPKRNGGWDSPFDPREVNNNFTEGNSWQYSFFVPQDIPGLIEAYGGPQKFEAKLDAMFASPSETTGREQVDITGLIGQYAHGNEPSHHMAYLYNYVGKPEKTAQKIHYILDNFYKNAPDGLIGNEDCGQMSAWYVLSSLGLYTVTPGSGQWTFTDADFKFKIHFEDGTTRTGIVNPPVTQPREIVDPSQEYYRIINPVPVITAAGKSFRDKMTIQIDWNSLAGQKYRGGAIKYRIIDESSKNGEFKVYFGPFEVNKNCKVEAFYGWIETPGAGSDTVSASFFKKPNDYTITLKSAFDKQYQAGGPDGLLDGILGTGNWRKGDWQGYQSQDFEAIVDLRKPTDISSLHARFLQDSRAWILMPTKVEYYLSDDNLNFVLAKTVENKIDPKQDNVVITDFSAQIPKSKGRYLKVKAYNFGKLPEWHQGYGGDAYIFIDEISIN
jgi:predicted alpha-1,2-mannosidase